ncbi:translation initiation factor 5 [Cryptococcus deuterogattii R265]|uniref:Translation initiation factor 5 n=1 Tax=Cryptococcus deuterogattii (strain R265) TaxID=294750 RepID=A0A095CCZ9_CRYD2|nr:translation initiation factor 5 [Cryptococcus deuterogattii R265]KIR74982.1 translation initiation factor 5 [Cryptococcus deuterogattii CA1014]
MATVNIRRDVDDKFYRYKMPLLQIKIEGRGNGIKTVVPNMEDIARALNRPPTYPTKFFGFELGAQTSMANDRYIVNGAHTADRLRELLDVFIEKFVLCPSCKNPETEIVITGRSGHEDMHRDCKACGRQNPIDMRHKLSAFIIKNPPKKKEKGGKKGKKSGGMTAEANVGGPMVFEKTEDGSGEDETSPDGAVAAVPTTGTEIDTVLGRADPILGDPDAAEAASKKLAKLDINGGGDEEEDEDADSPYAALGSWLEDNKEANDTAIIAEIKDLGIAGKHKVLVEIGQHLFSDDICDEISGRTALLQALVTSEKHQKSLLGGIERLIGLSPSLESLLAAGTTSKVLMVLYQADIIDEDVVQQWGTHVSKKYVDKDKSKKVRKNAEAFLKWLEEAEDESESDDE